MLCKLFRLFLNNEGGELRSRRGGYNLSVGIMPSDANCYTSGGNLLIAPLSVQIAT